MNLSNISSGPININDWRKNISFIRTLYTVFTIELLIALIWTSFAISYYDKFGSGIVNWWEFAIVSGSLCLILILVCLFIPTVRKPPINFVIYIIFTLCFMHFISYLCLIDDTRLLYYALSLLFGISLGYTIYSWS